MRSASSTSTMRPVRIEVERAAAADDPRQPLRAAVDQRDAAAPLGEAEAGVGSPTRRSHQSASSKPPARHQPVIAAIVGFGEHHAGEAERPLRQVEPRAERLEALRSAPAQNASSPAPVSDEHTRLVVGDEATERVVQLLRGRAVDRVAALGAVDGDQGSRAGTLVADHGAAPAPGLQPPRMSARARRAFAARLRASLRLSSVRWSRLRRKMSSGNAAMMMKPAFVTTLSLVSPYQPSPPSCGNAAVALRASSRAVRARAAASGASCPIIWPECAA